MHPKAMQFTVMSGGKTVRIDGAEPLAPEPVAPVPVGSYTYPALVLLHGAGGNVDFWLDRIAPFAAQSGLAVYAVHYFDCTGITRADPAMLTDGKHVPLWMEAIRAAVAAISSRPGLDAKRLAFAGISLGAFLSLALAAEGICVKAIVEISGGLVPPFDAEATRTFPPVLIVHGDQDTIVPVTMAYKLEKRLKGLAVPHKVEIIPGEGHWFSEPAQARILAAVAAFLTEWL